MRRILAGSESVLQIQVCDYIRLQYSKIMFHSDSAAGMKMSIGQASRVRRTQSGRAWPDLFIAEPRMKPDGQLWRHGLFIELKREGVKIYLKDGVTLVADEHIREQSAVLQSLRERGYEAQFGIGFNHCKQLIDKYLT